MPDANASPPALALRPLSIGEILDRAFQVYRRSFAPMYVLALVATVPSALYVLLARPSVARGGAAVDWSALGVSWTLGAFFGPFVWGALVTVVDGALQGRSVAWGEAGRRGLRAVLPLLGASLLLLLACTAVTVPVAIAVFVVAMVVLLALPRSAAGTVGVVTVIVLMAALVLALVLFGATIGFLLTPIVVLEHKGVLAALKRGYQLTRGARLRVLAITLLTWAIAFLPSLAVAVVPSLVGALRGTGMAAAGSGTWTNTLFVVRLTIAALATPFMVGCSVLAYYDRRVRLEGLDVELASAALEPATPARA